MDRGDLRQAVAEEITAALGSLGIAPDYLAALCDALSRSNGPLSPAPRSRWAGLVISSCSSASASGWRRAAAAAAAIEVLAAALELLDDLEDEDGSSPGCAGGRSVAENIGCGLLALAFVCAGRLRCQGYSSEKVAHALGVLAASCLHIGSGQHLDLTHSALGAPSEDLLLRVASLKSAELVKCACQIGAMLGTDDEDLVALYAQFGWHLGMFAQIINDIEAIALPERGKADVRQLKPTLPIAFWLKGESDRAGARALRALVRRDEASAREAIRRSGALHYAWTVAEIHREQASQILQQLDSYRPASAMLGYLVAPIALEALLGDR